MTDSNNINGIIKYCDLVYHMSDNYDTINSMLDISEGLDSACLATVDTLLKVYEKCPEIVKEKMYISLIKSTKNTNTSVTSGICVDLLEPGKRAQVLNCGTGAIKYQLYEMSSDRVIQTLHEYKPKTVSFSKYHILDIYGVKENSYNENDMIERIAEDLTVAHDKYADVNIPIYAVITGDIRKAWENADDKNKEVFESSVKSVFDEFGILPWNDKSFFISQDQEGERESVATNNLLRDVDVQCVGVGNFGIGKGSGQWTTIRKGVPVTTKHKFGMNTPENLVGVKVSLKKTVSNQFDDAQYISDLEETVRKAVNNGKKPVWALKSGCLIKMDKDKELKSYIEPSE
jgi:hypothetical protein